MNHSGNSIRQAIVLALAMISLFSRPVGPFYNEHRPQSPSNAYPAHMAGNEDPGLLSGSALDRNLKARLSETFGRLPMRFEANEGQADPNVKFLSRGPGYNLYLNPNEAVAQLGGADRSSQKEDKNAQGPSPNPPSVMRMTLVNANPLPKMGGIDALPGKSNYFIGNDPSKWRRNVTSYAKVRCTGVYPGIDVIYYGNQQQLEYDFIVAPGADPNVIRLRFAGMDRMEVDSQGDLVLHTANGDLRQHRPFVYQEMNGHREEIASCFRLTVEGEVGFEVASFDPTRPLVIDPVVTYSTLLGSSINQYAFDFTVDRMGSAYLIGATNAVLPVSFSPLAPTSDNGTALATDVFVTKFNPEGSEVIYSTFFGGAGLDTGSGITVDGAGNAYLTGTTDSVDFPLVNPLQSTYASSGDAFVAKLNASGAALVYSTYLGGSSTDFGGKIKVDVGGNIYAWGNTRSTDFPTKNPIKSTLGGGADAYITKLNASGSALLYSTYFGGGDIDILNSIEIDATGAVYMAGYTYSTDFPTVNAFQPSLGSLIDAFIAKLNPDGATLSYSTYLGGANLDSAEGITVDATGLAYVTGYTYSNNFPTLNPLQPAIAGVSDVFVTKFNRDGSALVYSSYVGGASVDSGKDIAVDAEGSIYVTGSTYSTDFPNLEGVQPKPDRESVFYATEDAFILKLDDERSRIDFSTYIGGGGADTVAGIEVDDRGSIYSAGGTFSLDFPTTLGAYQRQRQPLGQTSYLIKLGKPRRLIRR